jgi:hypothetical protein
MSSNRREKDEISMLSLHLIQNRMVYINTLAQPHWQGRQLYDRSEAFLATAVERPRNRLRHRGHAHFG